MANDLVTLCACHDISHVMRISRFKDDDEVWFVGFLYDRASLWESLKMAFKMIFRRETYVAEIVLDKKEIDKLVEFVKSPV